MYKEFENIILETNDSISTITINRPKVMNALCKGLHNDLIEAMEIIRKDHSIRVLILTGGKKAFVAGADIREMMEADSFEAERTASQAHFTNDSIEALPIPVIAAIWDLPSGEAAKSQWHVISG
jgi:enoyl-CoA hydratase